MTESHTRGETHGCIVCGRLYQLYVVYDAQGHVLGSKLMTVGGRSILRNGRALVACDTHTEQDVERAIQRVFGDNRPDEC